MKPLALAGAAAGGALGALIWAGISYGLSLEVGYVAWAIGGLVGCGAVIMGGRGTANGVACALIAVASIMAGKALGLSMYIDTVTAQQLYHHLRPQAGLFVQLKSEREYPRFMIEQGYSDASSPREVSGDELVFFKTTIAPLLRDLAEKKPRFIQWKDDPLVEEYVASLTADVSVMSIVFDNLDGFDLLWAILGIATAYRVGMATGVPEVAFPGTVRQRRREEEKEEVLMH